MPRSHRDATCQAVVLRGVIVRRSPLARTRPLVGVQGKRQHHAIRRRPSAHLLRPTTPVPGPTSAEAAHLPAGYASGAAERRRLSVPAPPGDHAPCTTSQEESKRVAVFLGADFALCIPAGQKYPPET